MRQYTEFFKTQPFFGTSSIPPQGTKQLVQCSNAESISVLIIFSSYQMEFSIGL